MLKRGAKRFEVLIGWLLGIFADLGGLDDLLQQMIISSILLLLLVN
jgi:hypothetical protein